MKNTPKLTTPVFLTSLSSYGANANHYLRSKVGTFEYVFVTILSITTVQFNTLILSI
jgi:hypothetical protein